MTNRDQALSGGRKRYNRDARMEGAERSEPQRQQQQMSSEAVPVAAPAPALAPAPAPAPVPVATTTATISTTSTTTTPLSVAFAKKDIGLKRKKHRPLTKLTMDPPRSMAGDTGLIGVCLVIRSRDGPRFVFHHPPRPITDAIKVPAMQGTEVDSTELDDLEEDDDDDTSDSDLEDDGSYHLHPQLGALNLSAKDVKGEVQGKAKGKAQKTAGEKKRRYDHVDPFEGDEHYDGPDGEHVVPWEHVFGYDTKDLESILTPSRDYHKKRFQLKLDPLYFLTYPIHIREDGTWKKKKSKKSKKSQEATEGGSPEVGEELKDRGEGSTKAEKGGRSEASRNGSDGDDDLGGMTMFNAVFVLSIPENGTDDNTYERIEEMYMNVAKDFNKALKHAQAQSNYVWKQSELILSMKDKGKEERRPLSWVWNEILAQSSLAGAIRDVAEAITHSKIATVHLDTNPSVDLSLQIPVPFYLSQIPSIIQPGKNNEARPGILVTTAEPRLDDEGNFDPSHLNKHFGLLLLDDKEKIIADIQAEGTELSAPLIEYIKLSPPTMSFLQVAQANSTLLADVKTLAQHLIYWRRAIPIPPLHARDTFIVSPNCDSRQLPNASAAWTKTFPLAPSLPTFLATLSTAPRPYKSFFPSKDHRSQYMEMLAWLLRGGWVTQLRTFAYIMVWPEIIYEVEYELMARRVKAAKEPKKEKTTSDESSTESTDESGSDINDGSKSKELDPAAPLTTEQIAESARLSRIAAKAAAEQLAFEHAFNSKPLPISTDHPSLNDSVHLLGISPYIIKDPHKVDEKDSLYMDAIAKRIMDDKARKNWGRFSKFFNGEDALEGIASKEGMKRKEAWGILAHYQEFLLIVRHW